MLHRHMALGAEPGVSNLEQSVVDGSVRLVTVSAIFKRRWMHPEERAPPLGMTGVAVFINTGLFELCRIGRAMRIVATRANEFPLSERHMGGAHELGLSLQMTLTANFYFCPPIEKWRLFTDLNELIPIGCFLHHGMAIDTANAAARVRARVPVSLDAALVTTETRFILSRHGFAGIFPECNQSANSFTAAGCHVIAARAVATFTSPFFRFVTRIEEENFPHHGLGEFLELFGVTRLANFVADVGWRRFFGGFLGRFFGGFCFRRPSRMGDAEQEQTSQ
jgi:hypothetical protein